MLAMCSIIQLLDGPSSGRLGLVLACPVGGVLGCFGVITNSFQKLASAGSATRDYKQPRISKPINRPKNGRKKQSNEGSRKRSRNATTPIESVDATAQHAVRKAISARGAWTVDRRSRVSVTLVMQNLKGRLIVLRHFFAV